MSKHLLPAIVAVIAFAAVAGAADPSLEVHLDPREFGIEDSAMLVVRILEPKGTPEIDLGPLANLEVVSGPSTKTEFSWINGAGTRADRSIRRPHPATRRSSVTSGHR